MAREQKSKVIGNFEYQVTQLGATEGRKVFTRLAKLLGAGAGSKEPIAGILAALNDEDVGYLCEVFAKVTFVKIDEKRSPQLSGIFEEHFAGQYNGMVKWLLFCLELNFASFFQEIGVAMTGSGLLEKASALVSPKE